MGEPQKVEQQNRNAPIKYDVEDVDTKINSSHLSGITSKATEDAGDCDINDDICIADQQKVMKESLRLMSDKKQSDSKKEEPK